MKQQKLRALAPAAVEEFRLNGFLKVEGVLTASEVTALGEHADLIAAGTGGYVRFGRARTNRSSRALSSALRITRERYRLAASAGRQVPVAEILDRL